MILISACLYGLPCRYDGRSCERPELLAALGGEALLPVCPEQLGGLDTPRPAAELRGGDGRAVLAGTARVIRLADASDVTLAFVRGAHRSTYLAGCCGVRRAILRAHSPSCGVASHRQDGALAPGPGVMAAALFAAGIAVEERE